MATVSNKQGQPVSREEQVATLVAAGITAEYARFIVALEAGETSGDVVALDDAGNEVMPEHTDGD